MDSGTYIDLNNEIKNTRLSGILFYIAAGTYERATNTKAMESELQIKFCIKLYKIFQTTCGRNTNITWHHYRQVREARL